ncbi:peroxiredoxin family protein [Cytobacillus praedii]|uniref:Redoxin domain-containing protein n=1 Tax=Cytobacillus praedii TaxID=1742358 RepID=A0A4R1AZM5_9BACI|nr:redoxin domain-containing protein [Cytobacillus praedii]MED3551940.1 redoxin domain-containing protein [Cytobacillus praedii]MED3573166.1 redoxin domain-containing protein [Cytobacillus praedii]TCJ03549.1 redoxin domain-containing protein [Cytobacillus praedii]
MLKKVIAIVFLCGLMTVAIVQAMEKNAKEEQEVESIQTNNLPGLAVGLKAPDFELKNLAGETVRLSDFKGQKIMLNFWATWCPPCKKEMPDMQKFFELAKNDVVILAVNIDPEADVAGFAKKMDVHFPILLDEKDKVSSIYKILTIPTTYFIDEDGIIRHKHLSAMTVEMMKEYTGL